MDNAQSIQMFLMTEKSEIDILDILGATVGFSVESTEVDIPDATGFAQISNYTQGFKQGILVTWPSTADLALSPEEIVTIMAVRLNLSVLLEPNENEGVWLLARQDGSVTRTDVNYLDDGIEISPL